MERGEDYEFNRENGFYSKSRYGENKSEQGKREKGGGRTAFNEGTTKRTNNDYRTRNRDSNDKNLVSDRTSKKNQHGRSNGIKRVYDRFSEQRQIPNDPQVVLVGKEVKGAEDIAKLSHALRNPLFETTRHLYVRDNHIVSVDSYSFCLPSAAPVLKHNNQNGFERIRKKIDRLNADGFFLLHNHPSGDPRPSLDDIVTTNLFEQNLLQFRGHVIINHTRYAFLDGKEENSLFDLDMLSKRYNLSKTTENSVYEAVLSSHKDVAAYAKRMQQEQDINISTLIFTNAKGVITEVSEISSKIIINDKNFFGFIKNEAVRAGATRLYVATQTDEVWYKCRALVEGNCLNDCILYDTDSGLCWAVSDDVGPLKNNLSKDGLKIFEGTTVNTKVYIKPHSEQTEIVDVELDLEEENERM